MWILREWRYRRQARRYFRRKYPLATPVQLDRLVEATVNPRGL